MRWLRALTFVSLIGATSSSPASVIAMPDHSGPVLTANGGDIFCDAFLDVSENYRVVTVWIYGPSDEFLGSQYRGEPAYHHINVQALVTSVGAGTYKCSARFEEVVDGDWETEWDYTQQYFN